MSKRDTKNIILDAAETLFSRRSYGEVTFRKIAERAGLHVSQIVYHFQSKELLMEAVINRRASGLNEERIGLLESYRRVLGDEKMEVEPIIRAFLDPYFQDRLADNQGWRNYSALVGKIVWDKRFAATMNDAYDWVAKRYIDALMSAAPTVSEEHIQRAFQFLLAAMFSAGANNKRIDRLSGGKFSSEDYNAIYEVIIPFIVGGFKALEGTREATDETLESQ
ncbi:MAG: TetR family transcriptional regulator [Alphaproteobacteria bacterium]|nr:TetR family transcriptional regulator [Alphaproteobacteria bacterium]